MSKGTVLLAEDKLLVRRYFSDKLKDGGYNVETFASSSELLKHHREMLAEGHPPAAIVINQVMRPRGTEFAGKLRQIDSDVPIIVLGIEGMSASSDSTKRFNYQWLDKNTAARDNILATTIDHCIDAAMPVVIQPRAVR